MSELLTIEAVGKFGPKANGKWWGVKKPLSATDFVKGVTYEVETEQWGNEIKGGFNIVSAKQTTQAFTPTAKSTYKRKADVQTELRPVVVNYGEAKDKRILVQGITQAVLASPAVASLQFVNRTELLTNFREVADAMIEYVLERSK